MNTHIELGQALRQLPQETPTYSLWPELQPHLPKKSVRMAWPLAAAASAILLAVLLQFNDASRLHKESSVAHHTIPTDIAQLMDRSAQLENIYYRAQDDGISSAAVIAANLNIEERLDAIDSQLANQQSVRDAVPLWQQRVELLDQGIAMNRANAEYNSNGRSFDLILASLN